MEMHFIASPSISYLSIMETIIQHTETFLTKIYEKVNTGITDVDELSSNILEDCKELARSIVQETKSIRYQMIEDLCNIFECTPNDLFRPDEPYF